MAALGLVRLGDPFMRMHAATKAGVVGSGLVVLGAALALGEPAGWAIGVACVLFLLVTSPIASHALGRAAYVSGAPIAPETVADALSGALPRNVFDISPGRTARPRGSDHQDPTHPRTSIGVHAMSALESYPLPSAAAYPSASPLRAITAWLVGGDGQAAAIDVALRLAGGNGAKLMGISAIDPSAGTRNEMVPIGGLAWSKWLGDRQRQAHRERSAQALAEFERISRGHRVSAALRHAEGDLRALSAHATGNDLVVVPASVDHVGGKADDDAELAAQFSLMGVGPVLRVARAPENVRRVVVLVDAADAGGRASQALIRTGMWREASIQVVPVGAPSDELAVSVGRQTELLRAHGYAAKQAEPIVPDAEREEIEVRIGSADAAVLTRLSGARGIFDAFRLDAHEFAAARCALVLLP
ncbi:MAG: monovalent cation/H(+) antiporter subunit G [Tagaea sp.]|nr:monovalent cation/H(+) antiporter subunit G [Tagaea sp.]